MGKDLRNAALEAFKRSARGESGGEKAGGTEAAEERKEAGGVEKEGGSRREGGGTSGRDMRQRASTAAARSRRSRAGSARESGARHAPRAEPAARSGVLVKLNTVLLVVLLVLVVVLLANMAKTARRLDAQAATLRNVGEALAEMGLEVERARRSSQAKFGVFEGADGQPQGVFVNYEKPDRYKVLELKPEE